MSNYSLGRDPDAWIDDDPLVFDPSWFMDAEREAQRHKFSFFNI